MAINRGKTSVAKIWSMASNYDHQSRLKVTYHRENFEMAVESNSFEIQGLGIKDYPPILAYEESFYAIIFKPSFFKTCFLSNSIFQDIL